MDVLGFPVEEVPESIMEPLEVFLGCLEDVDDDPTRDQLRELMNSFDNLAESMTDELGTLPEAADELDEKLWAWFQDLPDGEKVQEQIHQFLADVEPHLTGEQSPERSEVRDQTEGREDDPESGAPGVEEGSTEDQESAGSTVDTEGELHLEINVDQGVLEDFLSEADDEISTLENMMVDIEDDPSPEALDQLYRAMHTLKGGFGFCNLEVCTGLTHHAEDLLDQLREDPPDQVNAAWVDLLFSCTDVIRLILSNLQDVVEEELDEFTVDVSPEYVDLLKADLEQAVEGERDPDAFDSLEAEEDVSDESDLESDTVKVDLDDVGELVDLVGELVISHAEVKEKLPNDLARDIQNSFNQQEKILNELQERSMNMRMLPLKREFRKYPRIVRDLANELGKEVDLTIRGEQTELDKSVLDNLEGPLLHLVRNAVDHGIEEPEERRRKGKPEAGQLAIRAYHESGHVYIEIEEDGSGLPTDIIEEKAIERGLIEEDHDLSDDDINQLILEPGFSTADEVTDVSGRGVGMDVVATEIEQLRGNILIDSEPDEGTTFTLELPLTVAIIDGLITMIGGEKFIFPVNQVEESINPSPDDINWMQDRGRVVQFRDNVAPVIDPRTIMGLDSGERQINDRTIMVIVSKRDEQYAIWVDDLLAHEQIVIKQIESNEVQENELTAGGAILGDGTVGLIIDIMGLIREFSEAKKDSGEPAPTA